MADRRSAEAAKYRKLYKSSRWRALRQQQLTRQPLCERCLIEGKTTAATVVDHIIPHKGDECRFHDASNLQSMCAEHHDRDKRSEERRGYNTRIGADGFPSDPNHPFNRR